MASDVTATTKGLLPRHVRKRGHSHIPRPPNAFFLYRSDFLKQGYIPREVESQQYNLSRIAGQCWKKLSPAEKNHWYLLAKKKKEEHVNNYPTYKYQPQPRRLRGSKRRKRIPADEEVEHCARLMAEYAPNNQSGKRNITQTLAEAQSNSRPACSLHASDERDGIRSDLEVSYESEDDE